MWDLAHHREETVRQILAVVLPVLGPHIEEAAMRKTVLRRICRWFERRQERVADRMIRELHR